VEVLDVLRGLPGPVRAVYEAGPTGYGLVRRARAEGIEMAVCSPGNIERRPGDRIKTDKRDAIRLARLFCAGDLRLVWIPSGEHEQLRDLVRCRENLRSDLMRARHRRRRFAPHQLRHAHAVELAREGVPLNVIQRQLGHANLGTTSIYLQGIDTEEIIATVRARRAPMMSATAGLRL
jgi:transposase